MDCEEIFFGQSGSAVAVVDGAEHPIGPGDCLVLPPGAEFSFRVGAAAPSARSCACARAAAPRSRRDVRATVDRVSEPDFSILLVAANRCVADRLGVAVATVGGETMRPSFGFVIRAVAAEQPTVSRLAELLGVTKQAARGWPTTWSRSAISTGRRPGRPPPDAAAADRARRAGAGPRAGESETMEAELRDRFGDGRVDALRALLTDFVERHGGAEELAANRSRADVIGRVDGGATRSRLPTVRPPRRAPAARRSPSPTEARKAGHLVNGSISLPQPLQVRATNAAARARSPR